jgi:hypothetical protein
VQLMVGGVSGDEVGRQEQNSSGLGQAQEQPPHQVAAARRCSSGWLAGTFRRMVDSSKAAAARHDRAEDLAIRGHGRRLKG